MWVLIILHLQMVEVRVPNLDCEGCASKLKRALLKLKGMYIHDTYTWAGSKKLTFQMEISVLVLILQEQK